MRVLAITAVAGLVLLAGCDNQTDASPPPTTEDALTTATVAPTTPDDADVTSEEPAAVEPTTEEPTTDEPDDDGPPEMPAEAQEQTEEGAEAFVGFYLDQVSWAHVIGDSSALKRLVQPTCQSCQGLAESADVRAFGEDYLDYELGEVLVTDVTARVEATVDQLVGEGSGRSEVVLRLDWVDDTWLVQEITLAE